MADTRNIWAGNGVTTDQGKCMALGLEGEIVESCAGEVIVDPIPAPLSFFRMDGNGDADPTSTDSTGITLGAYDDIDFPTVDSTEYFYKKQQSLRTEVAYTTPMTSNDFTYVAHCYVSSGQSSGGQSNAICYRTIQQDGEGGLSIHLNPLNNRVTVASPEANGYFQNVSIANFPRDEWFYVIAQDLAGEIKINTPWANITTSRIETQQTMWKGGFYIGWHPVARGSGSGSFMMDETLLDNVRVYDRGLTTQELADMIAEYS